MLSIEKVLKDKIDAVLKKIGLTTLVLDGDRTWGNCGGCQGECDGDCMHSCYLGCGTGAKL